jgi:Aromatic prenyltransferase Orf2
VSGATGLDDVYSAIEVSARLLDVPCSRARVWPFLTAYGDGVSEGAIILSVSTGTRECDYTIEVPPGIDDPYAHALSNGFVTATDHPVGALLPDVRARVSVDEYFFDCGVDGGFKKLYASFRNDVQKVAFLADIPSMPRAVAENAGFFARHGLDEVSVVGIDYRCRTMNLYFQVPAAVAGDLEPRTILSMLRQSGLPEPDEQMLGLACGAYRIYVTLGWDSSRIQRMSFAPRPGPGVDLAAVQERLEPQITRFMGGTPYAYAGERIGILVPKWTAAGDHLNLGFYYQVSPRAKPLMAREKQE